MLIVTDYILWNKLNDENVSTSIYSFRWITLLLAQ